MLKAQAKSKILVVEYGSQYTHLIYKKLDKLGVTCIKENYDFDDSVLESVDGIILSGGPGSANDPNSPEINSKVYTCGKSVLGICYGQQKMASYFGGKVMSTSTSQGFGPSTVTVQDKDCKLFQGVDTLRVWMSHSDCVSKLPDCLVVTAAAPCSPYAAYRHVSLPLYGVQFHPEVEEDPSCKVLENFVVKIAGCKATNSNSRLKIQERIEKIKRTVGDSVALIGISGGVDSAVAAVIASRAIGKNLRCIYVDHGLMRKHETEEVAKTFKAIGIDIHIAERNFIPHLKGVSDPETKRKIIGKLFIDTFIEESNRIFQNEKVDFLIQGTLASDVIESSCGIKGNIKSHHNVGGLPEKLNIKIVEPLKDLFKDEVRHMGKILNISSEILSRHPFPGPGLAIRIVGEVTQERCDTLREADHIFISALKLNGLYHSTWQAYAALLSDKSVGVKGDVACYEQMAVLRAVNSDDAMTARASDLNLKFLAKVANDIVNNVRKISRVLYDITSKPPATIELE